MPLKSIHIKNFTVFENIECELSPKINIFIGENGTGKTHLLKILYAVTNTAKYKKSFVGDNTYDGKPTTITNNFDHVIYPLFLAPVEGLAIDLVRSRLTEHESARIQAFTDKETITAYVSDLGHVMAVNPSDISDRVFEQEALFIPSKDMLSHSGLENDYTKRLLPFDKTQINILNDLKVSRLREQTELTKVLTEKISKIVGGIVLYRDGGYFIDKGSMQVNISLEAEGFKKLAVLYRALDTGYLQPSSMLFWDEPEANMNPKLIPEIVKILLELSRHGVQIFLATHDYNLMKYFSMSMKDYDKVVFYSLYQTDNGVACEREDNYDLLKHNAIVDAEIRLLKDDFMGVV